MLEILLGLSILLNLLLGALLTRRVKEVTTEVRELTKAQKQKLYDEMVQQRAMKWCLRMDKVAGRTGAQKAEYVTKKIKMTFPDLTNEDIGGLIDSTLMEINQ